MFILIIIALENLTYKTKLRSRMLYWVCFEPQSLYKYAEFGEASENLNEKHE